MTRNQKEELAVEKTAEAFLALAEELKKAAGKSGRRIAAGSASTPEIPSASETSPAPQSFTFRPVKTMQEAAAIAQECCSMWRIDGDTDDTRLDPEQLHYACEQQDMRISFDPGDESKYYLVRPDGSIGVTLDGCGSIEWIFLPA